MKLQGIKVTNQWVSAFWARMAIGAPDACWPWTAGRNTKNKKTSYGCCWLKGAGHLLAHRVSMALTVRRWDSKSDVLHSCDNPICCNPDHLSYGDAYDNLHDMLRKGRGDRQKGEDRPAAKLTEGTVRSIRSKFSKGHLSYTALAREFGVHRSSIKRIVNNRAWSHVK